MNLRHVGVRRLLLLVVVGIILLLSTGYYSTVVKVFHSIEHAWRVK